MARLLGRIDDALDERPKGKLRHRALSNLPVVGVLGGYAAEREGLRRAAARAEAELTAGPSPVDPTIRVQAPRPAPGPARSAPPASPSSGSS